MKNEHEMAGPGPLDLRSGKCRLPFSDKDRGWVLPGGDIVYSLERAKDLAAKLDRDMKVTPHRYSAVAARAATDGR